jgi:hypothetical protein
MNTQNCNQKNDESPDPYYIMSPNQHWWCCYGFCVQLYYCHIRVLLQ